ncbi:MAG: hypothetical protein ACRED0_05125 [Gammaproteobacteria bacterium]
MYVFIELTPFSRYRDDYFTDDELAHLQRLLTDNPKVGDVIPGTGGVRKLMVTERHWKTRRRSRYLL